MARWAAVALVCALLAGCAGDDGEEGGGEVIDLHVVVRPIAEGRPTGSCAAFELRGDYPKRATVSSDGDVLAAGALRRSDERSDRLMCTYVLKGVELEGAEFVDVDVDGRTVTMDASEAFRGVLELEL